MPGRRTASGRPSATRVWSQSRPICSTSASTESNFTSPRSRSTKRTRAALAVEVAGEVEQVGLEQAGRGALVERRAPAQRDGRGVGRAVGPHVPAGVDAVGRQQHVAGHRHVGCRDTPAGCRPGCRRGRRRPAPRAAARAARAASATAPSASRPRMRVDDTWPPSPAGTPSASTRPRPSTSKPSSAPSLRSSGTFPARPWPKWKSSPTTTTRALRHSASTSRTKSSALSRLRASSNVTTRQ